MFPNIKKITKTYTNGKTGTVGNYRSGHLSNKDTQERLLLAF